MMPFDLELVTASVMYFVFLLSLMVKTRCIYSETAYVGVLLAEQPPCAVGV